MLSFAAHFNRLLALCFVAWLGIGIASAQPFYWASAQGGPTQDEVLDLTHGPGGSCYAVGYFSGIGSFGGSSLASAGLMDAFVVKYNTNGFVQWAVRAGGAGPDKALAISVDAAGNAYVTGFFSGTATFGGTTVTSAGNEDLFVAKYNTNGALQWVQTGGGPGPDLGNSIAHDANGNVAIGGQFLGTSTFGSTMLTSMNNAQATPSIDVLVAQLNAQGNFTWANQGAAPETDRALGVAFGPTGNVFAVGQFTDTITFDNTYANTLNNAIFVVGYDAAGTEQWVRIAGAGTQSIAYSIAADSTGGLYVAGDFQNSMLFLGPANGNPSGPTNLSSPFFHNVFVARYNTAGTLSWAQAYGSESAVSARKLVTGPGGDLYFSGNFACTFSALANAFGTGLYNSVGYKDVYVARVSATGALQQAWQLGGHDNDFCPGLGVNSSGDIFVGGTYTEDLNLPGSANYVTGLTGLSSSGPNYDAVNFPLTFCGEADYSTFYQLTALGNLDGFIGKPFDPTRGPFDFYKRDTLVCDQSYVGVCVNTTGADNACADDSIFMCGPKVLRAATNTATNPSSVGTLGPRFSYQWSTGSTQPFSNVGGNGMYAVTITSEDGCYLSTDSAYVEVLTPPDPPPVTDGEGTNQGTTTPQAIEFCWPDTITLSTPQGTDAIAWEHIGPNGGTGTGTTFDVDSSASVLVSAIAANGCSTSTGLTIIAHLPETIPVIVPIIKFDPVPTTDTVSFCDGGVLSVIMYDTLTNPGGSKIPIPSSETEWVLNQSSILQTTDNYVDLAPQTSGWYVFDATITLYPPNECTEDSVIYTLSDSVYVELLAVPTTSVNVAGSTELCPGDTIMLTASGGDSYVWGPPTNLLGNLTNDTVFTHTAGTYSVTSLLADSNGCTGEATASITVLLAQPTNITSTPTSGIICPNDSVVLTASGNATEWFGPTGSFSTDASVAVNTPGFYFCVVTDATACAQASNTLEVIQYATPLIQATADSLWCPGDSVKLVLFASDTTNIQWQAPLSGGGTIRYVTQPGTFSASAFACGLSETAFATVDSAAAYAQISTADSLIFYQGDSITLNANVGMSSYHWTLPNGSTASGLSVIAQDSGTYALTTSDSIGCQASDNLLVTVLTLLPAPQLSDTTICQGDSVLLPATSSGTVFWYVSATASAPLDSGTTFQTGPLATDTVFYAEAKDAYGTPGPRDSLVVYTIPTDFSPPIMHNGPLCAGDTLVLQTDTLPGAAISWAGPNSFVASGPAAQLATQNSSASGQYTVSVSVSGCPPADSIVLLTVWDNPPAPPITGPDSLCFQQTGQLVSGSAHTPFWLGPTGWSSNSASVVLPPASDSLAGTYLHWVTDSNGCQSDTSQFVLLLHPEIATPVLLGAQTACTGDTVELTAFVGPQSSTTWMLGLNVVNLGQTLTLSPVTISDGGTYRIFAQEGVCISDTAQHTLAVTEMPALQLTALTPDTVCPGDSIHVLASQHNGATYQWLQPSGATQTQSALLIPTANATHSGSYQLNVQLGPCFAQETYNVLVGAVPQPNLGNDTALCAGLSTQLYPGAFSSYWWSNGATDSSISAADAGTYAVTVWSNEGCPASTSRELTIIDCSLIVPNVITPNGDGINDAFTVHSNFLQALSVRIFNRWGQEVGVLKAPGEAWDGTNGQGQTQPDGTYYFEATWTDAYNNHDSKAGFFQLIRGPQ